MKGFKLSLTDVEFIRLQLEVKFIFKEHVSKSVTACFYEAVNYEAFKIVFMLNPPNQIR